MLKFSPLIMLSAGLLGLSSLQSASAQTFERIELTIDDFIAPHQAEIDLLAPPTVGDGNSLSSGVQAIGGERDLYVEKILGTDGERIRTRVNPNGQDLLRQVIDEANGSTFVTWDGLDGNPDPTSVVYNGLGSIDFTIYDFLEIIVSFSDLAGPVHFTFWDSNDLSGNTFAQTTFNVPGGILSGSNVSLTQEFSNFTANGASLTEILDSVGAIQMEIDATASAQEGWDMRLDLVGAVGQQVVPSVPEPSAVISLLALGALPLSLKLKDSKKQS